MLRRCYGWSRQFNEEQKPEILQFLEPYRHKLRFIKHVSELDELFR
ncbi:hypothetical protein [Paenibacillus tengchongensis]|nr:hypothetical protein [Paenibacillus tengchongensis]